MDDDAAAKWQDPVNQFGIKKSGANPWDAKTLEVNFDGASHGEKCVISFLLNVWDPGGDWSCGKFDVIDAMGIWNEKERDAFLIWAIKPWWP